jgi:beta-xylosidase
MKLSLGIKIICLLIGVAFFYVVNFYIPKKNNLYAEKIEVLKVQNDSLQKEMRARCLLSNELGDKIDSCKNEEVKDSLEKVKFDLNLSSLVLCCQSQLIDEQIDSLESSVFLP